MNKIMFNDKYGLTEAVLKGRKTMTRRMIKSQYETIKAYNANCETYLLGELDGETFEVKPCYYIGEVVAVAQTYESMANGGYLDRMTTPADNAVGFEFKPEYCGKGYGNKMFVKADLMPHQIRITDIKVERLQDISDEDCLKEGVLQSDRYAMPFGILDAKAPNGVFFYYSTPREAFAALIDKVSGRGTWENNPWVFAYSFKLFK